MRVILTSFILGRSEEYCIISTEQIKDKCLIMEVQSTVSNVFVSVLPNTKEVE